MESRRYALRTMRYALVEKMKRFYCWIKDGRPFCTWLAYDPNEGCFTDCTDMTDEQFESHMLEMEKICDSQKKFNELVKQSA